MMKNEKISPKLSILITMCLQNDFVRKLDEIPSINWKIFPNGVHIDEAETNRLWNNNLDGFINDMMKTGIENEHNPSQYYHFIHIRDWHDDTDPSLAVQKELAAYGLHCIKGTEGAKFISPLEESIRKYRKFNLIVNSNTLNSFVDTALDVHLNSIANITGCSKNQISIGIIGVVTNIKILFLVYDLTVRFGYNNVYVCEDLCAAFNNEDHKQGLNFIEKILDTAHLKLDAFKDKLNITN